MQQIIKNNVTWLLQEHLICWTDIRENFQKDDALCFKHNGNWIKYSSKEYIEYSYNFCYGLYELGLRKGDKIITVSSNRPEWNFVDMGMSMIGIVHVPVFTSLNADEYEYIIQRLRCKNDH